MRGRLILAILTFVGGASFATSSDPWTTVGELRDAITVDSPLVATFLQTYTPAGFSSGDTESGVMILGLPDCARWDYDEPFPKSFLLCDDVAWAWNPGEMSGRRYRVSPEEEQGLNLLRLDVEKLRQRFRAERDSSPDLIEVRLEPTDMSGPIAEATLTLTADGRRLTALAFVDHEGNRTVFELGPLAPAGPDDIFEPPPIQWLED